MLETYLEEVRQDTLESYKAHLIEEIEKIKEKVASTHGTNKYDGCYDDAISLIKEWTVETVKKN